MAQQLHDALENFHASAPKLTQTITPQKTSSLCKVDGPALTTDMFLCETMLDTENYNLKGTIFPLLNYLNR